MTSIRQHIRRVLNEEKISLKNDPVKYFYFNYLNKEPIEFKGLILIPNWDEETIKWGVENPNDYSYSRVILKEVIQDEFKSFCSMTNTDYANYYQYACWIENIPNGCYISKQDRKNIDKHGEQIKQVKFVGLDSRYRFDFDYEETIIESFGSEIDILVIGDIINLIQTNLNGGGTYPVNPRHFISDMTDSDYDLWKEELFNILKDIYGVLTTNPRIYDNRMDYFDLGLQQTP
jgi:hypothetical protein